MEEIKYISLYKVGEELGLKRKSASTLPRQLTPLGIFPVKVSDPANGLYQKSKHITLEEFERLKAHRNGTSISVAPALPTINDEGCFYLIDLWPGRDLNAYKLGFTEKGESRYDAFRIVAPLLQELKTWPCKRTCEASGLETVFNSKRTEKLGRPGQEVVECHDIDGLIARLDMFFGLMNGSE